MDIAHGIVRIESVVLEESTELRSVCLALVVQSLEGLTYSYWCGRERMVSHLMDDHLCSLQHGCILGHSLASSLLDELCYGVDSDEEWSGLTWGHVRRLSLGCKSVRTSTLLIGTCRESHRGKLVTGYGGIGSHDERLDVAADETFYDCRIKVSREHLVTRRQCSKCSMVLGNASYFLSGHVNPTEVRLKIRLTQGCTSCLMKLETTCF